MVRLLMCAVAASAITILGAHPTLASPAKDVTIKLKRDLVDKLKDTVSYTDSLRLDYMSSVHSVDSDADRHVVTRSDSRKLRCIAEFMNAHFHSVNVDKAMTRAQQKMGSSVSVRGPWRVWNEHPDIGTYKDGVAVSPGGAHVQNHIFEVHPISHFDDISVIGDIKDIQGYAAYDANEAIVNDYGHILVDLSLSPTLYTVKMKHGQHHNHVRFIAKVVDVMGDYSPPDGSAILVDIYGSGGSVVASRINLAALVDTPAASTLSTVIVGDKLQVLALTRFSLHRIAEQLDADPSISNMKVPIEFVALAATKTTMSPNNFSLLANSVNHRGSATGSHGNRRGRRIRPH